MNMMPVQARLDLAERDSLEPIEQGSAKAFHIVIPHSLGIILIVFSIIVISSFVYYLSKPETLPIKQVSVAGDFRNLSPITLQTLIKDRVKAGFFNLDVQDVRRAVIDEAWVDDVIVQRVWPDKVHVVITEKVPFAQWNHESFLTDAAVLFRPESNNTFPSLPKLWGPKYSAPLVLKNYKALNEQLDPLHLTVGKMVLDDRRSWSFEFLNGPQVIIGRENYAERIQRFMNWLPRYFLDKLEQMDVIDLRYTNGFAVRWQSESQ